MAIANNEILTPDAGAATSLAPGDWASKATQTYQALLPHFDDTKTSFWLAGHACDTLTDYYFEVDRTDVATLAGIVARKYRPNSAYWYDDYSWWGNAMVRAAGSSMYNADSRAAFLSVAMDAWLWIDGNAPNGWAWADQQKFAALEPLFSGGVWNRFLTDNCNPGPGDRICGRQNTVTNLGYLLLAERFFLHEPSNDIPPVLKRSYLTAAQREYAFLHQWMYLGKPDLALLNHFSPGNPGYVVMRERASLFKNGQQDPGYVPLFAWTGDQGLMVSALVDRMRVLGGGSDYQAALYLAMGLIDGVSEFLVKKNPYDEPGQLDPWGVQWPHDGYETDYWTGVAVFMRGLLYAYRNSPELKTFITNNATWMSLLRANAEMVLNKPDRPQSDNPLVSLTNDLAILAAAIAIVPHSA
ncbi:hypothetical protein GCM10007301_42600 [Azorhizobium oxalatiphilum]|uniref:Uncharacterized protein n=1 Tax=Azorhizobium oxalatiphilum TaxID=980631 RepID=A0A917CAJ5_9HYPH|nr:hypothetical protein [Azorhizobium oxalatiphilum]GGF78094.1 hypothetical protein GCM10007301_42600 [Azorhizobium oxalatiphilum]